MKKYLLLLLFLIFPHCIFANEWKIIYQKNLWKGIIWQQTENGEILKYKGKIIESSTWWFIDDAHMLCAYQGVYWITDNKLPFTTKERAQLEAIWVIINGVYMPKDDASLSKNELNILYRITSRYCGSSATVDAKIWNRWIYITRNNSTQLYDTKLGIFISPFLIERNLKKTKIGYFAISSNFGNEFVNFLPFDGRSSIQWIDEFTNSYLTTDYSLQIESYSFISASKIKVKYKVIWINQNITKFYTIITE